MGWVHTRGSGTRTNPPFREALKSLIWGEILFGSLSGWMSGFGIDDEVWIELESSILFAKEETLRF